MMLHLIKNLLQDVVNTAKRLVGIKKKDPLLLIGSSLYTNWENDSNYVEIVIEYHLENLRSDEIEIVSRSAFTCNRYLIKLAKDSINHEQKVDMLVMAIEELALDYE